MTIAEILQRTTFPRIEAELLLAHATGKERTWVLAHGEHALTAHEQAMWEADATRRMRGEPVSYIVGVREFYGREYRVGPAVLIPRPSTEGLIDVALQWLRTPHEVTTALDTNIAACARRLREGSPTTIVDIGTGSGCIAITLALELPAMDVIATDVSAAALRIAEQNAQAHEVSTDIAFLRGSLLDPIGDLRDPFLIVSNPPYIPAGRALPVEIERFEPAGALFAGPDGTDVLAALVAQACRHPSCIGYIMECEEQQIPSLDAVTARYRSLP